MRRRSHRARPVLAWLALTATVVVNVPHFDCVCPNGNRKPFCLSLVWAADCCCPAGHVGSSLPAAVRPPHTVAEPEDAGTVCCHCRAKASSWGRPVAVATAPCCQKTFVPGSDAAADPTVGAGDPGCLAVAGKVEATPFPMRLPVLTAATPSLREDASPPPPDLVITLRHLVI